MHLVGRTIIAQDGTNSAPLDISGGINVVGPSKLTDLSGAYVDVSGGTVDISGISSIALGSTNAVTVTTAGVVSIPNPTTDPTTSSNSALKVTGGVSIGGTCHVGDGVIVSGALSMSGGSISDVNGLAATGAISGFSLTDGSATLSSGSLTGATNITATGNITGGSLTATGDISCNGITILANGIKLPHTDSTSSTLTGGGFIATVTTNGLSGRIQVPTGSNLSAGAAGGIEWTNTTLQSDSIVLLTLDSSKNSINAWDSCTVTRSYNSGSAPANNIIITNNDSANWTAAAGETYYINFLIINPT